MDGSQGLVKCSVQLAVTVICPRQLSSELEVPMKLQL